jgi:hypothetical protein
MKPGDLERYKEDIRCVRTDYEGRIHVQIGLELEYLPGFEAWTEKMMGGQAGNMPSGRFTGLAPNLAKPDPN